MTITPADTPADRHSWPQPVATTLHPDPPRSPLGRRSGTTRAIAASLAVVALVGASLFLDAGALFVVPLLFVLVVPFEKLFPRHHGQRIRRRGVRTDIAYALASPALNVATIAVALVIGILTLAWLPGLAIRPLVAAIPSPALPFVGIALFDLTSYWVHRWAHEVPVLWRFHAIHHSPETMDWVSGFRNHPAEGAILAPPFFFLLAAGFDSVFTGLLAIVQIGLGLFLHANVRWRLRPLDRIFVTPEFHHWHHSNDVAAHHTNYSIFLPLWDIVFGTFRMPRDERPTVYGVDEPIPAGMLAQLWWPVSSIGNPLRFTTTALLHPIRSARHAVRFTRTVLGDVWASTRRPTRSRSA